MQKKIKNNPKIQKLLQSYLYKQQGENMPPKDIEHQCNNFHNCYMCSELIIPMEKHFMVWRIWFARHMEFICKSCIGEVDRKLS
jgi:hypothetical protein